jgi:uncharacterized protein (DUF2267 family)
MFEMELRSTVPALAACRSVLNVLARKISRSAVKAIESRMPRTLRPAPVEARGRPEDRGRDLTLRLFFDEIHVELRKRGLTLPPGKLARSVLRLVSLGVGAKERARLAGHLPEPLRELWRVEDDANPARQGRGDPEAGSRFG